MHRIIGMVLIGVIASQSLAYAIDPPLAPASTRPPDVASAPSSAGTLKAAVAREAGRLALAEPTSMRRSQPAGSPRRSWIGRHPALTGALIGAGGGAIFANVVENETFCRGTSNDCLFPGGSKTLVGAGMGAGIGALIGLIVGAARKD